jgi:sn-glycerol 3-phosphate transport system permease protein
MAILSRTAHLEIGPSGKPLPRHRPKPLVRQIEPYLYLLPTFVLIGMFQYFPFFQTIFFSFSQVDQLGTWQKFVGFDTYLSIFTSPEFLKSLWVTAEYMLMYIPGHLILILTLAFMSNNKRLFSSVYQTMFAMPMAISMSAACKLFQEFMNERTGIFNWALMQLGILHQINDVQWFKDELFAMPGIVILSVWHSVGFHFILSTAAIRGVPADLMENADLAGANWFQRVWHITLPMISPTLFFIIVTTTIGSIGMVTPVNIITQGMPNNSTLTLMYYIFQQGYRYQDYMTGSAGSIIMFVIMLIFTLLNFMYEKKGVFYG